MLKKKAIAGIISVGLILIITALVFLAFSQINFLKTLQARPASGWEVGEPLKAGETFILEIKAGGSDWGHLIAGQESANPVQLDVTFKVDDGGEASFSCWYTSTTPSSGSSTPVLSPVNATVIENNASESLEPVSNAQGEPSCFVKTDMNLTVGLDENSVLSSFGPLVTSPPILTLIIDVSKYPYPYFFVPGLLLFSAGSLAFAYGVYANSRGGKRRKVRR
jgi:hypothetical protein